MAVVACPGCQARYRVPASAAGRRTTCRKCGKVFRVPAATHDTEHAAHDAERPASGGRRAAPGGKRARPGTGAAAVETDAVLADLNALASGEALDVPRSAASSGGHPSLGDSAEPAALEAVPVTPALRYATPVNGSAVGAVAYARYLAAIGRSLVFLRKPGNIFSFLVLWLLLACREVLQTAAAMAPIMMGPWFFGAAAFIITGWYMAFKMSLVTWAAGGDEELPPLAAEEGIWDGVVIPCFRMLATYVFALLPAAVFLITLLIRLSYAANAGAGGPSLMANPMPGVSAVAILAVLTLAGCFAWPMLVLVVSCGESVTALFRLDLIAETIVKSLPAYLLTVLAVYVAFVGQVFVTVLIWAQMGQSVDFLQDWTAILLLPTLLVGVKLFFDIVAMRAIGHYYSCFKHKFAWSWG